jgi:hypothetical protein
MLDPQALDPGGAWLLDRIAARRCHDYFCGSDGTHQVDATYLFELDGVKRPVTYRVWECDGHHSPPIRQARPSR